MPEAVLALVIVLTILGLAFYGFIQLVISFSRSVATNDSEAGSAPAETRSPDASRSFSDDILGASHLLNHLFLNQQIDEETYHRTRDYLEKNFEGTFKLADLIVDPTPDAEEAVIAEEVSLPKSDAIISEETNVEEAEVEIVAAPADSSASLQAASSHSGELSAGTAPWDMPDPPEPQPRRSFSELMSGFMLEKNIRWGELASGILIVGSAVGLVVSLRNELRDTIPYFSALLFLLITAAIHGAGIYTIKKWRLRNTSRGTLLIGLLLVPLNIVAACVLTGNDTDRRELTDPLLWMAIIVGLSAFTTMTWFSSKCLFRRGQLPIVIAIIGCAIATLLINRTADLDSSSIRKILVTVPIVLSFLVGTAAFYKRQWLREYWPERTTNRLLIFLGLSAFAFVSAASMLIVRAEDKSAAVIALLPAFTVVCIMTTWLGRIIWTGAGGCEQRRLKLVGLTLHILGLSLLAVSLFSSAGNPTVLLINALVVSIGMILFARHQEESRLLPVAWTAFGLFVLCLVNLLTGELKWDAWTSLKKFENILLSGESALSLLASGAAVCGFHYLFQRQVVDNSRFLSVGYLSGAALSGIGCILALIASFQNPEDTFDVMTATSLLALAALAAVSLCVFSPPLSDNKAGFQIGKTLPHATAVIVFGFLAHAFLWNKSLFEWLNTLSFSINANAVLVLTVHAIILALVGVMVRIRITAADSTQLNYRDRIADSLGEWSAITNSLGLAGAILLVQHQTGLATSIAISLSAVWFLLVWLQSDHQFGVRWWMNLFTAATGIAVVIFVAELLTRTSWCPASSPPRHFLVQLTALSIWAILWFVATWLAGRVARLRKFTDFHPRVEWIVTLCLTICASIVVGICLFGEARLELFADAKGQLLPLGDETPWVYAALGGIGLSLLAAIFKRPLELTGLALIAVWLLAWGFGAECFSDSKSVATVLRWLLPIGGAIGAVLVASRKPIRPVWIAARNRFGLTGRSTWPKESTQTLINVSLAAVACIVLCISTIAIARVLLTGGTESLGGPVNGTWLGDMRKDVLYGGPVGIMVGTFLLYAISERRKWLATAGSAVFQYCVILSVILLFLSPHPKLASSWFVNILQAVSLGMTGYGFVWYFFRERIEGTRANISGGGELKSTGVPQIEVHTFINGLLITALAVLVMVRFYTWPDLPGDWINTVGGVLGVFAWAIYGFLAFIVWRKQLNQPHRTSTWMWLACWLGLVLVGMIAAFVDRRLSLEDGSIPWLTFKVIMCGAVLVCFSQVILLWLERKPEPAPDVYNKRSLRIKSIRSNQTIPLLFATAIVTAFAVRGMLLNPAAFWIYFAAMALSTSFVIVAGMLRQSGLLVFISSGMTATLTGLMVVQDPESWFAGPQPHFANVMVAAQCGLAIIWSGFYVYRTLVKGNSVRTSVVWVPNLILLLSSIWIFLGGVAEWAIQASGNSNASSLGNSWGVAAITLVMLACVLQLWNDRRRFQVVTGWLWLLGLAVFAPAFFIADNEPRNAGVLCSISLVVSILGVVWLKCDTIFGALSKLHAPRLVRLERKMDWQFPVLGVITGLVVLFWAFASSLLVELRPARFLMSMSPFAVAFGLGCMSNQNHRRWLQLATLALLTIGAVLVAWAELSPITNGDQPLRLFVRGLLVLAGAMFIYGGLVSRWVREDDSWLKSLREMTVVTCAFALACFAMVLAHEFADFVPDAGCGMPLAEAVAVAAVVTGMIVGLILIAILPENDPFSLSLSGRMGYVYAAQLVAAMLLVHLYLTMPFLFQIGIKYYWPYIAMVLSFGGVGVAHVLENRKLTVLATPLFNTASMLPVVVAASIWAIDSKADPSLVMLTVGMAYLMISYIHHSILSGAAAILFGNLALWLFYDKFDGFSFVEHPQLWLIPPAMSVLAAAQISKPALTRQQLALIRYICLAVIYLSSTSEIFINGLGQKLWPPVILAVLALIGIMAGMMLQIRAFLYLGSLFLLLAMTSMVSHAHQRLDHVWPWWAFGVSAGIAILVMFGLFENRKKNMKEVVDHLNEWDL